MHPIIDEQDVSPPQVVALVHYFAGEFRVEKGSGAKQRPNHNKTDHSNGRWSEPDIQKISLAHIVD